MPNREGVAKVTVRFSTRSARYLILKAIAEHYNESLEDLIHRLLDYEVLEAEAKMDPKVWARYLRKQTED